ncbi:MerR family transcriptional regulator [Miltoncostaea oceani]|uniref:MerR family transcriptional regulator n=1 Tax=Miltoncostaea oceani TaxID=2843216 RepID=UPI001C3D01FE|nr:helix-turn-helix domain-containing protein [Miltoncostaea oceani]
MAHGALVTGSPGRQRRSEGPWLSVSAAARALGVSPSTLRLWASEGRVPHVRTAGGHRRFDPEALRQWLARQPARPTRPPRPAPSQIPASATLADVLRARADLVSEAVEALVEGPAEAAYRRLPPTERRGVVRAWVDALADGFATGSLNEALERAETYGRGHGLAGSSAEVTLGGSLALERAMDRALAAPPSPLSEEERREVVAAMSQLTVRVATAWAAAVAGRGARPG